MRPLGGRSAFASVGAATDCASARREEHAVVPSRCHFGCRWPHSKRNYRARRYVGSPLGVNWSVTVLGQASIASCCCCFADLPRLVTATRATAGGMIASLRMLQTLCVTCIDRQHRSGQIGRTEFGHPAPKVRRTRLMAEGIPALTR